MKGDDSRYWSNFGKRCAMEPEKLKKLKIDRNDPVVSQTYMKGPAVRGKKWRYSLIFLLVAALGLVALQLYGKGVFTRAVSVQIVAAGMVHPSQTLTEMSASGYVVAQRRASVASKGTGRLVYLGVKEGSRVRSGDVIARLDDEDLNAEKAQAEAQLIAAKAELAQAETELETAERSLVRYQRLLAGGGVSQESYDTAKDRALKAQAAVGVAKAHVGAMAAAVSKSNVLIEYTRIRAPFDGVILTKNADIGEVVAPFGSAANAKAAVVTMADLSSLMIEADVAEASIESVREEQPCEIQLDAFPTERFQGHVDTIVPTADRTRGSIIVKVRFDSLDPRIMPEMSGRILFLSRPLPPKEEKPFLGVHKDALTKVGGAEGVFKIGSDQAHWTPVSKPEFFGDYIRLESPFQTGDRIVLKPSANLKDGSKVKSEER
jgi:RND family efflux transporter MFP subunit